LSGVLVLTSNVWRGPTQASARPPRPLQEARRVNVDFPAWMAESLDREARRLGVTRQSVIKIWIAERLEQRGG
jgi:hypothetical protein